MNAALTPPTRVIKLGGSLLDEPTLSSRFAKWLQAQSPARNIVVVGGGRLVDAIREIDRRQHFDDATAHWLAIDAMSVTARLAAALLKLPLVEHIAAMEGTVTPTTMLDVRQFLREEETQIPGERLPHGWHVTSDSIAARVAIALGAAELVLLKSALPARHATLTALAQFGYVDAYFVRAVADVPVRCVNLREDSFPQYLLNAFT